MSGLWFAVPGELWLVPVVLLCFGVATIGAELATVFTNAMMPGLVSAKRLGTLSGVGWAMVMAPVFGAARIEQPRRQVLRHHRRWTLQHRHRCLRRRPRRPGQRRQELAPPCP